MITNLRDLWRHRLVVLGVFLVALAAGILIAYKVSFPPKLQSRSYDVGVATAQILVDSPSSEIVDVAPRGVATIGVATQLLASLMVDGPIKSEIAAQAGLQPSQLIGTTDAATAPSPTAPVSPAPAISRKSYVLSTQVLTNPAGDDLPIIALSVQAPNQAAAAKLVAASVAGVHAYLDSTAAQEKVPRANLLQVTGLDSSQAQTVTRGPTKLVAALVLLGVFLLGCLGILAVLATIRGWQAAAIREQGIDRTPLRDLLPTPRDPGLNGGVLIEVLHTDDAWSWPGPEPAEVNGRAKIARSPRRPAPPPRTEVESGPRDKPRVEVDDAQEKISALMELLGGDRSSADAT